MNVFYNLKCLLILKIICKKFHSNILLALKTLPIKFSVIAQEKFLKKGLQYSKPEQVNKCRIWLFSIVHNFLLALNWRKNKVNLIQRTFFFCKNVHCINKLKNRLTSKIETMVNLKQKQSALLLLNNENMNIWKSN